MFSESVEIIKRCYEEYKGSGMYLALFFVALIYVFLREENKNIKTFFGYYSIAVLLFILNPLFNKIVNPFININIYWRMFWLLPVGFAISYVAVKLIQERNKKSQKILLFVAICLIIISSGKLVYNKDNFKFTNNLYKLPDEAKTIAYLIVQDDTDYKKVMLPETLVSYIRQISPEIELKYGRQPINYDGNILLRELKTGNVEYVTQKCKETNCNYIIFSRDVSLSISPKYFGYEIFAQTENYDIYKLIKE